LQKVHQGDTRAFGTLYNRYRPRLFGYCYRLLGDRDAAEDVVQTTFLKAFASLSYAEIARLTGDTISAIESRLFKARRALAEKLAPYFGTDGQHPGRHK
jgi:DNA-directed RNA polymerase specialized sigma24 family protein